MCVCVFSPVMNVIENKIAIMEAEPHFVSDSLNYFFNVRVTDFFWSRKNRSLWSSGQVEDNKAATETLKKLIFLLSETKANFIRFVHLNSRIFDSFTPFFIAKYSKNISETISSEKEKMIITSELNISEA